MLENYHLYLRKLFYFFKLVRLPNLIIVGITQYLIYRFLLGNIFNQYDIESSLNYSELSIFIFITLCITAGGYIINDIFDLATDLINKPLTRILNLKISTGIGWYFYFFSTILGAILAFYLAQIRQEPVLWFLYPIAIFLLYAYSKWLKGTPLMGNILVSIFCAAVPGIFFLTEWTGFKTLEQIQPEVSYRLKTILFSYAVFAFFTNFLREIVKDLQDEKGDRLSKLNTTVVFFGKKNTKIIGILVALLSSVIIIYCFLLPLFFKTPYLFNIQLLLIQLPLFICIKQIYQADKEDEFKKVGLWIKIIMINGLILLTYIIFQQNG